MTKDNLAQTIAKKVGISKRQAAESLTVVLDEISKTLSKGEEVVLTGFGKFLVKDRKIGTGPIKIPKFKPGQTLKDAVK